MSLETMVSRRSTGKTCGWQDQAESPPMHIFSSTPLSLRGEAIVSLLYIGTAWQERSSFRLIEGSERL